MSISKNSKEIFLFSDLTVSLMFICWALWRLNCFFLTSYQVISEAGLEMLVSFKKLRLSVLWKVQSGFGWVSAKLHYGEGGVGNCISKETPIGTENDVRAPLNTSNSEFCLLSDSLTEKGSWKEGVTNSPVASMFQFLKKNNPTLQLYPPRSPGPWYFT